MKRLISLLLASAMAGLTAVAAWRLSVDALALFVGVLLGMLLMVPCLLLITWAVRHEHREERHRTQTLPTVQPVLWLGPGWTPPAQTPGVAPLLPTASNAFASIPDAGRERTRHWDFRVYGEAPPDAFFATAPAAEDETDGGWP